MLFSANFNGQTTSLTAGPISQGMIIVDLFSFFGQPMLTRSYGKGNGKGKSLSTRYRDNLDID